MRCPAYRRAPALSSTYVEFFRSGSSNSFNRSRCALLGFGARAARRALGVAGNLATGNLATGNLATGNLDRAHPALELGTDQIDVEEPVIEPRAAHFDAFGEDEGALELARGDAAVQINPLRIVGLLAADDELVVFDRDPEVAHREAGYREGDAQRVLAELLDIVGRISVARNLADPIQRTFKMVEPQQQGRIEQRQ